MKEAAYSWEGDWHLKVCLINSFQLQPLLIYQGLPYAIIIRNISNKSILTIKANHRRNNMRIVRKIWTILAIIMTALLVSQIVVLADDTDQEYYYFNDKFKIKDNKGYSLDEQEKIKSKDVHYGWDLGSLYVTGYTQRTEDLDGNPVFLKNAGDKVKLGFDLQQDIDKLNGNEKISIGEDKKGYDSYFEIPETNFGRGTLIVQHTDYQNVKNKPQIYTNFLTAEAETNANTGVDLNEEGDYEVALDYVVKNSPRKVLGKNILPTSSDYTIRLFKFSVRNGNSMVFPLDVSTGQELSNRAFTENGFRIDLAKSRYLKVFVRRDDDSDDTRENKPAKDGDTFTKEGVYTITVEDPSTNQTTTKKIYVGTDERYKAFVTTGYSLEEIDKLLSEGATINEDGYVVMATGESLADAGQAVETEPTEELDASTQEEENSSTSLPFIPIAIGAVVLILAIIIISSKNKSSKKKTVSEREEERQNS